MIISSLLLTVVSLLSPIFADVLSLPIEYSLNDWKTVGKLGVIEVKEDFSGNYSGVFRTTADALQLGNALQSASSSALYRVRTPYGKGGDYVSSSTEPCRILQTKLVHNFWVSLDTTGKAVQSLTVFADPAFKSSDDGCQLLPQSNLVGIVQVTSVQQLKSPDTQSFLDKMDKERRARQHGAEQDNRSFLAKYWMYIVPVVIFMLISSASQQQEGGQGG
ncbi:unnamed protein product, partial [Mesorhabditis belari]|uniref:ER membrane protein complex subunit 10 n=1 Tax=Mesorhabditis belari TaxID=2138241 RepID=A0AAF3EP32_9BILA